MKTIGSSNLSTYALAFVLVVVIVLSYSSYSISLIFNAFESPLNGFISSGKVELYEPKKDLSVADYDFFDFENFDNNETNRSTRIIVPNIVHLIYLEQTDIRFTQMINIFSIFLNHRPNKIYIHCSNCSFYGPYWERILACKELVKILVLKQVTSHTTIFGVKARFNHHHRFKTTIL